MTHQDFFRYHNRLIRFKEKNGSEGEGVIVDIIPYSKKKKDTDYIFISIENLEKWKVADKLNNELEKNKLQLIIDINDIIVAERLNTFQTT